MESNSNKQELIRLCELASKEQNPEKLLELIQNISRLLEERQGELERRNTASQAGSMPN